MEKRSKFICRNLISWYPVLASKSLFFSISYTGMFISLSKSISFFFSVVLNHSSSNLFFSLLCLFCFDSFSVFFFSAFSLVSISFYPFEYSYRILLSVSINVIGRWNEWFLCIEAWVTGDKTVLSITFSTLLEQPEFMELWNEELPARSITSPLLRDKESSMREHCGY